MMIENLEITISKRIQSAIDFMERKEYSLALSEVCIAIDITAQKYYEKDKSSGELYKRLLKEKLWIIAVTGFGDIITPTLKIPFHNNSKDLKCDDDGYCTLEQIIYHVARCGLIHGTGENSIIRWNTYIAMAIDAEGYLNIRPSFIWGLILCVVVNRVNINERVGELCWISTANFKYLINDLWGKEESVKNMIRCTYNVDIENRNVE